MRRQSHMSDPTSRGLDIFRLQIGIQTRAIKIAATMLLMCAIAVAGLWVWYTTRLAATEWDGAWDWTIAAVSWKYLLYDFDGIRVFTEDGWRIFPASQIYGSEWHYQQFLDARAELLIAMLIGLGSTIPAGIALYRFATRRGRDVYSDVVVRGPVLKSKAELKKLVRKNGKPLSTIEICDVAIPERVLNRHTLLLGSTRSGKSLNIKRMLRAIRERGDLVIVYDKVGDMVAEFHDAQRGDLILNPLDRRGAHWSPWAEGDNPIAFARMAASFIPRTDGDKNVYFQEAARTLFVNLLDRVGTLPGRSVEELLRITYTWKPKELAHLLRGTEAARHFDGTDAGKDVQSTLGVFTQALRYLPIGSGEGHDVSLGQFIRDAVAIREGYIGSVIGEEDREHCTSQNALSDARLQVLDGVQINAIRSLSWELARKVPLLPHDLPQQGITPDNRRLWATHHNERLKAYWSAQDAAFNAQHVARSDALRLRAHHARRGRGAPWIFLSTGSGDVEAMRPLISAWIDTAVNAILSLTPREERRIWIVLDEWHTLLRLNRLQDLLAEGAKYGASVIAGSQNIGQIRTNYGRDNAEVMLSLFGTKAIFRMPEPDSARWASRLLGEQVWERASETVRYGTSATMDGASISGGRAVEAMVSETDIIEQRDLQGYLSIQSFPTGLVNTDIQTQDSAPGALEPIPRRRMDELVMSRLTATVPQAHECAAVSHGLAQDDRDTPAQGDILDIAQPDPQPEDTAATTAEAEPQTRSGIGAPSHQSAEPVQTSSEQQHKDAHDAEADDRGSRPLDVAKDDQSERHRYPEEPLKPARHGDQASLFARGELPIDPQESDGPELSDSELERRVLELHANGASQRKIAEQLNTSKGTVHRIITRNEGSDDAIDR